MSKACKKCIVLRWFYDCRTHVLFRCMCLHHCVWIFWYLRILTFQLIEPGMFFPIHERILTLIHFYFFFLRYFFPYLSPNKITAWVCHEPSLLQCPCFIHGVILVLHGTWRCSSPRPMAVQRERQGREREREHADQVPVESSILFHYIRDGFSSWGQRH